MTRIYKIDVPLVQLDDWDLLEAAFYGMLESVGSKSLRSLCPFDFNGTFNEEFPENQTKNQQKARLKLMMSQRNIWGYDKVSLEESTPIKVLEDLLKRIQNEVHLSETTTLREILNPYREKCLPKSPKEFRFKKAPWTPYLHRDFLEFIFEKVIQKQTLLTLALSSEKIIPTRLTPGEQSILNALKKDFPKGLTVRELASLTKKDEDSEETPRGSLDVWIRNLSKKGMITDKKTKRPKTWFYVQPASPLIQTRDSSGSRVLQT
ncbi:MAG: hypothetical protein K2X66_10425 [Cyanobacteria bacterium]|nr:hypothetical protein [Cyanobacteriota bacterium]